MRKLIVLIAALAAFAVPAASAMAADSVIGSGQQPSNIEPENPASSFTFDVNATSDFSNTQASVSGTLSFKFRVEDGGETFTGIVNCLIVGGPNASVVAFATGGDLAGQYAKMGFSDSGHPDSLDAVSTVPEVHPTDPGCGFFGSNENLVRPGEIVVVDDLGPPPPPVDTDGDGVTDDVDACPNVAGNGPNGCPRLARPANPRDCNGGDWKRYKRRNGARRFHDAAHCKRWAKRH